MTTKYNRELKDYRDTKNKAEAYKRRKMQPLWNCVVNMHNLDELKISHHNHLYDQEIKMIRKELKEFINERGK